MFALDQLAQVLHLVRRRFEDEFVVDLEQHRALESAAHELVVDADHRQLDEVRGGALQRRVHGGALGEAALVGVAAVHVGDGPHAAEQRFA